MLLSWFLCSDISGYLSIHHQTHVRSFMYCWDTQLVSPSLLCIFGPFVNPIHPKCISYFEAWMRNSNGNFTRKEQQGAKSRPCLWVFQRSLPVLPQLTWAQMENWDRQVFDESSWSQNQVNLHRWVCNSIWASALDTCSTSRGTYELIKRIYRDIKSITIIQQRMAPRLSLPQQRTNSIKEDK